MTTRAGQVVPPPAGLGFCPHQDIQPTAIKIQLNQGDFLASASGSNGQTTCQGRDA